MKIFYIFLLFTLTSCFFTGCYTIEQSYHQIKILMSQDSLSQAISDNKNNPDREEKLNLVQPVLKYVETEVHLTPKNSYQKFVELKSPYISWVVMASSKRSLSLKTWWFPFVGEQPYLGFFYKEDALQEREKLNAENYDVSVGGVKAFSLLGYYPDPLYSSMLEDVSIPSFIETLIHETVHRTMYVKGDYAFNENLANFIARKATADFLKLHPELGINSENYINEFKKNQIARQKFQQFFMSTKSDLEKFYAKINSDPQYKDEAEFLKVRQNKFDEISANYLLFMNEKAKDTNYEFAFSKGKFNNAVLLSYAVYEENQAYFEDLFKQSHLNLKQMVDKLKKSLAIKN